MNKENNYNKARELINKYKTSAPDNRCWWTCVSVLKRLPKKVRDTYVLVEGKADGITHYWLEDDKEILDIHYEIIDEVVNKYVAVSKYKFEEIKIDNDSYDERWATMSNGNEKLVTVPSIEFIGDLK